MLEVEKMYSFKAYCKLCGKPYRKRNGKSLYCSDACKNEAARQKQAAWRKAHPGYLKEWRARMKEQVQCKVNNEWWIDKLRLSSRCQCWTVFFYSESQTKEAQDISEAVLDAEVRIGELMRDVPKATTNHKKSDLEIEPLVDFKNSQSNWKKSIFWTNQHRWRFDHYWKS